MAPLQLSDSCRLRLWIRGRILFEEGEDDVFLDAQLEQLVIFRQFLHHAESGTNISPQTGVDSEHFLASCEIGDFGGNS